MDYIIQTENLTKNFKNKQAVKDLNIHVKEREIYAFLGLNGAGKTTTIKMLNGLLAPTSGNAYVGGYTLTNNLNDVKKISSFSPQECALSGKLTVYENIFLMASIHDMPQDTARQKTEELIERFHLQEYVKVQANKLSGGYQRRLSIAMALVSDPQVLYLDEPTLGMDVISRRGLWKLILQLKEHMTIVLTTHYLEEVEALSDHIGIIKDGELLFEGTLQDMYAKSNKDNIEDAFIEISGGDLL